MGRVKVVGYAKKEFFNDSIIYRNFSDSLVGQQFATDGGTPLTTIANFDITTNLEPKPTKIFHTNKFSKFFTLKNINVTERENEQIKNNILSAEPNFDNSELSTHALFGSLKERIRVALENIITKWPASIQVTSIDPDNANNVGDTVIAYDYDPVNNVSTFTVNNDRFVNPYNLNYLRSGKIIEDFNPDTAIRNFTKNHKKYVISNRSGDFDILSYTGSSKPSGENVHFKVRGNAFPGLTASTNSRVDYHVKPNSVEREKFFTDLNGLESHLLNRFSNPMFTAQFRFPVETNDGVVVYTTRSVTWPRSDGYNLDFESETYTRYVSQLIEISDSYDSNQGDTIVRQMVADALSEFDTISRALSVDESEFEGQKITKLLRIYGREFDRIKSKIDAISFANVVTYDKKNNTPDSLLKDLAKVMGWETLSPIFENDLLKSFFDTNQPKFSGHSRGLTEYEAEVELWRRLILNTPWLWKSKGTRKAIEFLLRFIGAPKNLINLDEYVYVADAPQNMEFFERILQDITDSTSLQGLSVDRNGYPSPLRDTSDLYFQKAGLWFRETGGENAVIDKLKGNNPHVGPYDGGDAYLDQFRCLIPDFSSTTLVNEVTTTAQTNVFRNYNKGMVNKSGSTVYASLLNEDNIPISGCPALIKDIIVDPIEREKNECGCPDGDYSVELKLDKSGTENYSPLVDCDVESFELADDGRVYFTLSGGTVTSKVGQDCCEDFGFDYLDCQGTDGEECIWNTDDCITDDETETL